MTIRRVGVLILFCVAIGGFAVGSAHAQAVATMSGTVQDGSGAVLPGAQVAARNEGTLQERNAITDSQGHYVITLLPIGKYTVGVTATGFNKAENTGVSLEVGQSITLDFKMTLQTVSQQLEVTGESLQVQVERTDGSLGQLIHTEQVSELPLNGRNFVQLALLTSGEAKGRPGTFLNQGGTSEVAFRASVSLSSQGMRENANDWLYDGLDNNELTAGGVGFLPSIDAISEFKIVSYNFSAQYGSRAGNTVLVSSKSGTNSFHGSAFEFLRNDVLDARNFFDGPQKGKYIQNEYGASLGGPVVKSKTFFFLDFQVNTSRQGLTILNSVPTALEKQGIFTESFPNAPAVPIYDPNTTATDPITGKLTRTAFANMTIPSNRISTIAKALLAFFPDPTFTDRLANNYLSNPVKTLNDGQWDIRLDHELTTNDHIFARFSWDNANQWNPGGLPGFASTNQTFTTHARNMALSWSHVFSPSVVNQVSAGYNRDFNYIESFGFGTNESQKLGIPGANLGSLATSQLTRMSITAFATLGDRVYTPYQGGTGIYNYVDTLHIVKGQHSLVFGFDFRAMQLNLLGDSFQSGTMSFNRFFTAGFNAAAASGTMDSAGNALASFMLGLPASGSINADFFGSVFGRRWKEYRGFGEDNWTVNRNLNLQLGLAYAVTTPISESSDRISNLDFATGKIYVGGVNGGHTVGVKTDFGNIEPRIGFAWTPSRLGGLVVRGGYGIYHDYGSLGGSTGEYQNPPFANAYTFNSDSITAVRTLSTGFPITTPPDPVTYPGVWHTYDANLKQGLVQQWNLNLQDQVAHNYLLTVAYTGTRGSRLNNRNVDLNTATPGSGNNPAARRPYPQYNQILETISNGWVKYDSGQVKLERRTSGGLYALVAYTYSKALSNGLKQEITGDPGVNYFPFSPFVNADTGATATDMRHNLTISFLYDLPFGKGKRFLGSLSGPTQAVLGGWQVNGVMLVHSGFALGETMSTSASGTSFGNRPNIVPGCAGTVTNPTPAKWFDTSCFSSPATGVLGNAPRTWLYGPGQVNVDMSFSKNFALSEQFKLQFRSELFNIFNHAQFAPPAVAFGAATFGTVTSTVNSSRQVQFALKLTF
jgi:hypothetical protein